MFCYGAKVGAGRWYTIPMENATRQGKGESVSIKLVGKINLWNLFLFDSLQ